MRQVKQPSLYGTPAWASLAEGEFHHIKRDDIGRLNPGQRVAAAEVLECYELSPEARAWLIGKLLEG